MPLVFLAVLQPLPPSRRDVDAATKSLLTSIIIVWCSCATGPERFGDKLFSSVDLGEPICNSRCWPNLNVCTDDDVINKATQIRVITEKCDIAEID